MQIKKPRVRALFTQTLEEFTGRDIQLSPEDVVWVYHAVENYILPDKRDIPAFFSAPIEVGKVWLYPLTIVADQWIENFAAGWFEKDRLLDTYSIAFAMYHSEPGDLALTKITTRKAAVKAIKEFTAQSLPVSLRQLQEAVGALLNFSELVPDDTNYCPDCKQPLPSDDDKPKDDDPYEWGPTIAMLCGTYKGIKPKTFLCEMSAADVAGMIKNAPLPPGMERPAVDGNAVRAFGEFRLTIQHLFRKYGVTDG